MAYFLRALFLAPLWMPRFTQFHLLPKLDVQVETESWDGQSHTSHGESWQNSVGQANGEGIRFSASSSQTPNFRPKLKLRRSWEQSRLAQWRTVKLMLKWALQFTASKGNFNHCVQRTPVSHAYWDSIHKAEIWDYHKHPPMDEWKEKVQGTHTQRNTIQSLKR